MIYITGFMWLWPKRKSIRWGTQQRDDEPLSWDDCFRYFGLVSVIGVLCWSAMGYKVHGISSEHALAPYMLSKGWVRPSHILLSFFPILGGFAGSVWIARFTSRSFPWIRSRNLFCIPEEIDPPEVVGAVGKWEQRFQGVLPDAEKPNETVTYALSDLMFFIRHRPGTRSRPHTARSCCQKSAPVCHCKTRSCLPHSANGTVSMRSTPPTPDGGEK